MSYYSKKLYPFVENLIRENYIHDGDRYILDVDSLDDSDQHLFAMHLIENGDRDLVSIYENNKHDDIVSSLVKLLTLGGTDEKLDFAETVRDRIVFYYKPMMQKLIDDIIGWVEQEDYMDSGYRPRQHKDNGETYWIAP